MPKRLEAPPPLEPEALFYPPPIEPIPDVIETHTTRIIENPTPSEIGRLGGGKEFSGSSSSSSESESEGEKSTRSKKSRKSSRPKKSRRRARSVIEEDEESIGGPLAVVIPDRRRKSARDIESEIRALEAEKKALKLEREADQRRAKAERIREAEYEVVDRKDRNVVRVEKDRRGRLAIVRSTH